MKTINRRYTIIDLLSLFFIVAVITSLGGVVIGTARVIGLVILFALFYVFCKVLAYVVGFLLTLGTKVTPIKVVDAHVDEVIPPV